MAAEHQANVCAIYTRKSSEEGLDQTFNSLDAQREACEAYVLSQRHEGWRTLRTRYDDGGYSGGNTERPALKRLLADIEAGKINTVVVYKVDRLTRSLADFAKIIEIFEKHKASFVSITQQFNTTTSMGRLTLNVLLSFAQFEREVTGERIRDKIAASKRKGMWMGGMVPLGYAARGRKLVIIPSEAKRVRWLYRRYLALGCVRKLKADIDERGFKTKVRRMSAGRTFGGTSYSRGALYQLLKNPIYLGEIHHKGQAYPGQHDAIVPRDLWEKVQSKLRSNSDARRNGVNARCPSLLAGLLYDDRGQRLTPSHAVKKGKRYRYYISKAAVDGEATSGHAVRIPAHDLEAAVVDRLKSLLSGHAELVSAFRPSPATSVSGGLIASAHRTAKQWNDLPSADQRRFLCGAISKIVIGESKIEIRVSLSGLLMALLGRSAPWAQGRSLFLRTSLPIHRDGAGAELHLITPPSTQNDGRRSISLLKAVARAREWYEGLVNGNLFSVVQIAKQEKVTVRYAWRVLEAAFLAPDIVECLLEGKQAMGLSAEVLRRQLPCDWDRQRELLEMR